jgi:mannan polymerase II complex MNN10 subunit
VIAYHTANGTEEFQLSEQDCMRDIMFKLNKFPDSYTFVPQHKLNAFPPEIQCYDKFRRKWEAGTFVLHFAGAWAHVKEEDPTGFLMRKYESQIMW